MINHERKKEINISCKDIYGGNDNIYFFHCYHDEKNAIHLRKNNITIKAIEDKINAINSKLQSS